MCHRIREFDPHTPVVFLSGAAYESDVREALSAGAQIYITKPADPKELELAVARLSLAASTMVIEARKAEIAAIREELSTQFRENAQRYVVANGNLLRAEKKALRAKANMAFLGAMGTRGDFARLWPSIYLREVRNRHNKRGAAATTEK